MALPLALAPPADALGVGSVIGRPGAVSVNLPMTAGYDQLVPEAGYPRLFKTNGINVRRSAASTRWQRVEVRYALQRGANGKWTTINSQSLAGAVVRTGRLTFPSWQVRPSQPIATYGYRFVYVVRWEINATGRKLASEVIYPNKNGENACYTRVRRCVPYYDGVQM